MTVSKFGLEFLIQSPAAEYQLQSFPSPDGQMFDQKYEHTGSSKVGIHVIIGLLPRHFSADLCPYRV